MRAVKAAVTVLILSGITGCSAFRSYTMPDEENLLSGAGSIVVKNSGKNEQGRAENYELVHIDQLLHAYGLDDIATVSGNTGPVRVSVCEAH